MNRAMTKIFIIMTVLFVALIVNLTWIMGVRADWYRERPENKRSIAQEMKIERGDIVGYDGTVLAGTERRSGYYYRDYPNGTLAPQLLGSGARPLLDWPLEHMAEAPQLAIRDIRAVGRDWRIIAVPA